MARTVRTYTREQRDRALAVYRDLGPSAAARETGVPRATVSQWARRAGVTGERKKQQEASLAAARRHFDEQRARLRPALLAKVHDLLARMDEPHVEFVGQHGREVKYPRATARAVQAYATSVGILIDKMRLESGEATERTEQLSQSEFDREVADLVAKLAA